MTEDTALQVSCRHRFDTVLQDLAAFCVSRACMTFSRSSSGNVMRIKEVALKSCVLFAFVLTELRGKEREIREILLY